MKNSYTWVPALVDVGTDNRCRRIAAALANNGFHPVLFCDWPVTHAGDNFPRTVQVTYLTRRSHCHAFIRVFLVFNLRFALKLLFSRHCRLCLVVDCPPLLPAALVGALRGIRVVYDARELFPQTPQASRSAWRQLFWTLWETLGIALCKGVITVSPHFHSHFSQRFPRKPVVTIYNATFSSRTAHTVSRTLPPANRIHLIYQGELRRGSGLETAIRALKHCPRFSLDIYGDGAERRSLEQVVQETGLTDRVTLHGTVPAGMLPQKTARAHIGLHLLSPLTSSFDLTLSNKIFEYMHAGLPVLLGNTTAHRAFIQNHPVGIVVDADTTDTVREGLERIITDYRVLSHAAVRHFPLVSWESQEERLIPFLQNTAGLAPPQSLTRHKPESTQCL